MIRDTGRPEARTPATAGMRCSLAGQHKNSLEQANTFWIAMAPIPCRLFPTQSSGVVVSGSRNFLPMVRAVAKVQALQAHRVVRTDDLGAEAAAQGDAGMCLG